jgi:hypothetical protein
MRFVGLNRIDEHCLLCGDTSTTESGHYHYKHMTITAGWCEKHVKFNTKEYLLPVRNCSCKGEGCYGEEGELALLVEEIMREDERKRLLKQAGY